MQLKSGSIAATLGALAAGLLSTPATAQQQDAAQAPAPAGNAYDQTASEVDSLVSDSAVLFYQEDAGRVRAIEAETGLVWNGANGLSIAGRFTYDSLTGATPNGATRANRPREFIGPAQPRREGERDSSTGASGAYSAPAGTLPVDPNFKDERKAVDLGVTLPPLAGFKLSLGGNGSWEGDYTSWSWRVGLAKELFDKNTTLSVGYNYEHDESKPITGIPMPLGSMGDRPIGKQRIKRVDSFVAGITQVLTPNWLVQLNWSTGNSRGYHTDPYKLVTLTDSASGDPFFYIYESRPRRRIRNSVFLSSKLALGSYVTDASARWYHDSWGITAWTFGLSEHVPVGGKAYVEPLVRYYHQGKADFFRNYLLLDEPTPTYVSADSRLGAFHAWTFGVKGGVHLNDRIELYGSVQRYVQNGQRFYANAPGNMAKVDLFAGSRSISVVAGLRFKLR
ncbi:DUF3570 domain-containing protein [Novosphingobium percolationis]|uniref:DUF3570 domain-containing protein n=1 Tax=Novosphingobium percolationis TaxID=2871811 RepID=UPI001CD7A200|nr:DUF3570 domain-containing protein [Novosphingobium percolationis]